MGHIPYELRVQHFRKMVETRQKNGSYIWSEERKRAARIREIFICEHCGTKKETIPFFAKKRRFCSNKCSASFWFSTDKGQEHLKALQKIGTTAAIKSNKVHTRAKGGYRNDIGHYVRSSWEANYCRYLLFKNRLYFYEPKTFELPNGKTYTPDFYLVDRNIFVEIKGWMTKKSKNKIALFREIYPKLKLKIIDEDEYTKLSNKYSGIIIGWEGHQTVKMDRVA